MRDPLSIPQEDLITETRAALKALQGYDPRLWSYTAIAEQLAELTGKNVNVSNCRRFILEKEKPIVFSFQELHKVHKFAIDARDTYEREIRGISLSPVFNVEASKIEINLTAEQAKLVEENPNLRAFIESTVHNAIELFASSPKLTDGPA